VELHDDTGSTCQAWIQPSFVQSEKQQHADSSGPKYIRPGYVWCLQNVTIMLHQRMSQDDNESTPEENTVQRMLLVSEHNVVRVWTPESLQETEETAFVRWMEQRDVFQRQWEEEHASSRNSRNSIHEFINDEDDPNESRDSSRNAAGQEGDLSNEEEEEEEDDEDRYRRYHLNSTRRSLHAEKEKDVSAIGAPKITTLHAHSTNQRPTPSQSQQPPQQRSARASVPPSQQGEKQEDDETTALLMRTLMNQSQSPSPPQQAQVPETYSLHQSQSSPRDNDKSQPQPQQDQPRSSQQPQFSQLRPLNPYTARARPCPDGQISQSQQQPGPNHGSQAFSQRSTQPMPHCAAQATGQDAAQRQTQKNSITQSGGRGGASTGNAPTHESRRVSFSQLPPPSNSQEPHQKNRLSQQTSKKPNDPNINKENRQQAHRSEAPKKKNSVDLSRFAATSAPPTAAQGPTGPPCATTTTSTQPTAPLSQPIEKNACQSSLPPSQASSSKDKQKRKKKKAKNTSFSPLSQSPKPTAAKLWTAMFDSGGDGDGPESSLLGLSSDEEEDDQDDFPREGQRKTSGGKNESTVVSTIDANSNSMLSSVPSKKTTPPTTTTTNSTSSSFGAFSSSLFQAACMPGMDLMDLSDEDD
jgi:hypothetical protein